MRNDEELVERVLAGLGKVEAPAGLEVRVLRGVRGHAAEVRGFGGWVWGLGLAGVVAMVMVVGARWSGERTAAPVEQARVWRGPRVEVKAAAPMVAAEVPVRRARAVHRGAERVVRTSEAVLAVSEMRARSEPAPVAPLTEEERLLRRVARKGDVEQVAMLDPMVREAREAKDMAEGERFVAGLTKGLFAGMTGDHE